MTHSLRWPRLAVTAGFLSVAIGWIAYTAIVGGSNFGSTFDGQNRWYTVFGLFSVVGYAILATASWSWFRWIERSRVPLNGMTRALRLFALGSLCLAAGLAAVGYYLSNLAVTQPYDGRTTPVAAASYGFEFFGFLLAAVAFWGASSEVRAGRPDTPRPEEGLVAA
jgi:hypothetical protein